MNQYELIRIAHRVYGKGVREISREYGHHRSTIRKALAGTEPGYQRSKTPDCPAMDVFSQIVERWLLEDRGRPKKQRHTAKRVYDRLAEEHGFQGGESTVRRWVRRKKRELGFETAEAMVPLCPEVGKEAEIDWGAFQVIMRGVPIQAKLFCMRSRYSGKSFARAYPLERQEMFFDGHIHGFSYFGGVYPSLVYDNLATAVKRILKGKSRQEQSGFVSFRSYYTFEVRFHNPGKAHEKGGVEGLVGYSRRNFMVPVPEVNDFEELNLHLIEQCDRHAEKILPGRDKNIRHYFEEEKEKLLSLPCRPFDEAKYFPVKVTKYQTVRIDRNWYSVPTSMVGLRLNTRLGCWTIELYDGTRKVAEHPRVFERDRWILDPLHYLKLLKRKPGAFDEARPILQWRESWPQAYEIMLDQLRIKHGESKGTCEFLSILALRRDFSEERVAAAVEEAIKAGAWNCEAVKQLLFLSSETTTPTFSLSEELIPNVMDIVLPAPDIGRYDSLLNGGLS